MNLLLYQPSIAVGIRRMTPGPVQPHPEGLGVCAAKIPEEAQAILTQAMMDGRDAAKFTIQCGLDTTDSLSRAILSSLGFGPLAFQGMSKQA